MICTHGNIPRNCKLCYPLVSNYLHTLCAYTFMCTYMHVGRYKIELNLARETILYKENAIYFKMMQTFAISFLFN